jgi:hypothetical protein
VAIYDGSVRRLLADTPKPTGVEYHLGVLQVALALEALLNRLYAEFIFPRLSSRSSDRGRERNAEARWLRAPQLIQSLRGMPRRVFDRKRMPYRGLAELIARSEMILRIHGPSPSPANSKDHLSVTATRVTIYREGHFGTGRNGRYFGFISTLSVSPAQNSKRLTTSSWM